MLKIQGHEIIAIRKNSNAKIHIKYVKNGVGKSICGKFSEHKGFIVDELEDGVDSLQAIIKDNNICKKCLLSIEDSVEMFGEDLEYALKMIWVQQSWNYVEGETLWEKEQ